jgi:D-alanyl-D-alanine carboxypeptidase
MLEWGVRAFERKTLFANDEVIGELSVYGGEASAVVKARGAVDIFVPITNPDRLTARISYRWPLRAPIEAGAEVGVLKVYIGDLLSQETPLYTENARSLRGRCTARRLMPSSNLRNSGGEADGRRSNPHQFALCMQSEAGASGQFSTMGSRRVADVFVGRDLST